MARDSFAHHILGRPRVLEDPTNVAQANVVRPGFLSRLNQLVNAEGGAHAVAQSNVSADPSADQRNVSRVTRLGASPDPRLTSALEAENGGRGAAHPLSVLGAVRDWLVRAVDVPATTRAREREEAAARDLQRPASVLQANSSAAGGESAQANLGHVAGQGGATSLLQLNTAGRRHRGAQSNDARAGG